MADTPEPPASRTAPPTTARPIELPRRPSRWPLVVGVISVVLGAGGMLAAGWQAAQPYFMETMLSAIPEQQAILAAQRPWRGPMAMVLVPGVLLAGLLLWGGVQTLRRRRSGRPLLLAWSGLRVVQGLALAAVMALMQRDQMQAVMGSMGNAPGAAAAGPVVGSSMAAFTAILIAGWALAWPLVLLVWLTRANVKADVAGWGG